MNICLFNEKRNYQTDSHYQCHNEKGYPQFCRTCVLDFFCLILFLCHGYHLLMTFFGALFAVGDIVGEYFLFVAAAVSLFLPVKSGLVIWTRTAEMSL